MVSRKGTGREIATQGLSSLDGLGIATQGFIEPILGDLILGGEAIINYRPLSLKLGGEANIVRAYNVNAIGGLVLDGNGLITFRSSFIGDGGLVLGGIAGIAVSVAPTVGGNMTLGGSANYNLRYNITPTGGLITDGAANVESTFNHVATGGLIVDGSGNIVFAPGGIIGDGGLIIGGEAIVDSNVGPVIFGRGGARIPPKRRQPITTFEPPVWNPDDYLQPMDYLKKIQNVLDQAEKDKLETLNHVSNGTVTVTGRGKIVVIYRDQPDGEIIVANNPPLEPIVLELPHVFNKGATALEIAELEDHLVLNDLFGLGDYNIKKGPKARYVYHSKKTTGGAANVRFISGGSNVKLVTQVEKTQRREDDEFMLEVNMRTQQDREEEELRMLGIID
jgi:hypothetical protein